MVYSSAYRRAYRKPLWDDYGKEEFISKLQYRSDRRSIEHRHQPWRWDSESEEEDIEEIPAHDGSYDGGRRQFHLDEKKADKKPPKNAWEEEKDFKENDHAERALPLPERLKFDEAEKEEKPKYTRSAEDARLNERESRGGRDHRRKHHRSSGDEKKQRSHSNSPEKDPISRDRRKKAPFLPYGMANEGPVDMWKTHNVLASQPEASKQIKIKLILKTMLSVEYCREVIIAVTFRAHSLTYYEAKLLANESYAEMYVFKSSIESLFLFVN